MRARTQTRHSPFQHVLSSSRRLPRGERVSLRAALRDEDLERRVVITVGQHRQRQATRMTGVIEGAAHLTTTAPHPGLDRLTGRSVHAGAHAVACSGAEMSGADTHRRAVSPNPWGSLLCVSIELLGGSREDRRQLTEALTRFGASVEG